ncbi:hypothetical protein CPB83DRAFT_436220 [Crepidotus variabilis]|uniref:Lysine-specific metallo-endopeptidase domain-containing protein n=1 Tax=Crepidotus variabilis TaxID=179855 RepID=A0A9P6EDB9_9AGAR|nr:hypothetical protein CPB83DRAFT_436220 [Crepidotus variabilis]
MLSFYRISVLLALVQAVLPTVVLSLPLGIEYDKPTSGPASTANKQRLDDATALANTQIGKMREGLNKAKAGEPKAKALYEAAFGKAGTNSDMGKVDDTVKALETGKLKAKLAAHPFANNEIAAVPWTQDKKTDPWVAGPARFGKQFHESLDVNGRAGTVIHEATHQLKKTGDEVHKTTGKIFRADEDNKDAHPIDSVSGYTSAQNMHKTTADVAKDKKFTAVRDKASNMHDNAESYAVFASLCSQPGALRRRDLHLFNRALVEGDDEQLEYLSRRNSCKLPPNYLAKKAAAKKGGKPTTAQKPTKPAAVAKVSTKPRSANVAARGKSTGSRKPVKAAGPSKKIMGKAKVPFRGKVPAGRKPLKAVGPSKKSMTKARSAKLPTRDKATGTRKPTKPRAAKAPSRAVARKPAKRVGPTQKSPSKARPATRGKVVSPLNLRSSPAPPSLVPQRTSAGISKQHPKLARLLKAKRQLVM